VLAERMPSPSCPARIRLSVGRSRSRSAVIQRRCAPATRLLTLAMAIREADAGFGPGKLATAIRSASTRATLLEALRSTRSNPIRQLQGRCRGPTISPPISRLSLGRMPASGTACFETFAACCARSRRTSSVTFVSDEAHGMTTDNTVPPGRLEQTSTLKEAIEADKDQPRPISVCTGP